jgi:hypothetical protein
MTGSICGSIPARRVEYRMSRPSASCAIRSGGAMYRSTGRRSLMLRLMTEPVTFREYRLL